MISLVAHALFGYTLSFWGSVASEAEAFIWHAAGQSPAGITVGPAALSASVQLVYIFGLSCTLGSFLQDKRNLSLFLHLIFSQKTVRLYTALGEPQGSMLPLDMISWHSQGCTRSKHAGPCCNSSPLCKYISSDDKLLDQARLHHNSSTCKRYQFLGHLALQDTLHKMQSLSIRPGFPVFGFKAWRGKSFNSLLLDIFLISPPLRQIRWPCQEDIKELLLAESPENRPWWPKWTQNLETFRLSEGRITATFLQTIQITAIFVTNDNLFKHLWGWDTTNAAKGLASWSSPELCLQNKWDLCSYCDALHRSRVVPFRLEAELRSQRQGLSFTSPLQGIPYTPQQAMAFPNVLRQAFLKHAMCPSAKAQSACVRSRAFIIASKLVPGRFRHKHCQHISTIKFNIVQNIS